MTALTKVEAALVELPIRYMHTTDECVAVKDIEYTGRLLAEFVASLEADFLDMLVWE